MLSGLFSTKTKLVARCTSNKLHLCKDDVYDAIIEDLWKHPRTAPAGTWVIDKLQARPFTADPIIAFRTIALIHRIVFKGPPEVIRMSGMKSVLEKIVSKWDPDAAVQELFQALVEYGRVVYLGVATHQRWHVYFTGNWSLDSWLEGIDKTLEDACANDKPLDFQLLSSLVSYTSPLILVALKLARQSSSVYFPVLCAGLPLLLEEAWALLLVVTHIMGALVLGCYPAGARVGEGGGTVKTKRTTTAPGCLSGSERQDGVANSRSQQPLGGSAKIDIAVESHGGDPVPAAPASARERLNCASFMYRCGAAGAATAAQRELAANLLGLKAEFLQFVRNYDDLYRYVYKFKEDGGVCASILHIHVHPSLRVNVLSNLFDDLPALSSPPTSPPPRAPPMPAAGLGARRRVAAAPDAASRGRSVDGRPTYTSPTPGMTLEPRQGRPRSTPPALPRGRVEARGTPERVRPSSGGPSTAPRSTPGVTSVPTLETAVPVALRPSSSPPLPPSPTLSANIRSLSTPRIGFARKTLRLPPPLSTASTSPLSSPLCQSSYLSPSSHFCAGSPPSSAVTYVASPAVKASAPAASPLRISAHVNRRGTPPPLISSSICSPVFQELGVGATCGDDDRSFPRSPASPSLSGRTPSGSSRLSGTPTTFALLEDAASSSPRGPGVASPAEDATAYCYLGIGKRLELRKSNVAASVSSKAETYSFTKMEGTFTKAESHHLTRSSVSSYAIPQSPSIQGFSIQSPPLRSSTEPPRSPPAPSYPSPSPPSPSRLKLIVAPSAPPMLPPVTPAGAASKESNKPGPPSEQVVPTCRSAAYGGNVQRRSPAVPDLASPGNPQRISYCVALPTIRRGNSGPTYCPVRPSSPVPPRYFDEASRMYVYGHKRAHSAAALPASSPLRPSSQMSHESSIGQRPVSAFSCAARYGAAASPTPSSSGVVLPRVRRSAGRTRPSAGNSQPLVALALAAPLSTIESPMPKKVPASPVGLRQSGQEKSGRGSRPLLAELEVDLDEIKIERKIGAGATAQVYKGVWRGTDVALKRLNVSVDDQCYKEFFRELSIMVRLRHPNLVLLMGATTRSVLTEYCAGGTLFELLHRTRIKLTWRQKLKLAMDVAKGCTYLHACTPPIIHRDLKSLNILLIDSIKSQDDIPTAKVSDFGLSKICRDFGLDHMTGMAGTYHWMAPEVLYNEAYNEKVDVHSFAIVLYEIVTGTIPYQQKDAPPITIAMQVANGLRPDLQLVPPSCPPKIKSLMQACWHREPQLRPSFAQVLESLKEIGDSLP